MTCADFFSETFGLMTDIMIPFSRFSQGSIDKKTICMCVKLDFFSFHVCGNGRIF